MSTWIVKQSLGSKNAINPIRNIVDRLDMNLIPKDRPYISLSIGDPTKFANLKPPDICIKAVQNALLSQKFNGYPPSMGYLKAREVVASKYSYHYQLHANDVFLTSGCSDAINIAMGSLLNAGDNILLPSPNFSLYKTICGRFGYNHRLYRLLPEKNWQIDVAHLESLIDDKTKAILINNPANPCGSVFTLKNLNDLLQVALKYKLPIISDEIYDGITFGDTPFIPLGSLTQNVPVITLGGVAKKYLVPGWRLGWILLYDPMNSLSEVRKGITSLTQVILGPNSIIQAALCEILNNTPQIFHDNLNKSLKQQSTILYEGLNQIYGLHPVPVQGAMYIMIKIDVEKFHDIEDDIEFASKLLQEEGVGVLPATIFDAKNFFRCVTLPPPKKLYEAIRRISSFTQRHTTIYQE